MSRGGGEIPGSRHKSTLGNASTTQACNLSLCKINEITAVIIVVKSTTNLFQPPQFVSRIKQSPPPFSSPPLPSPASSLPASPQTSLSPPSPPFPHPSPPTSPLSPSLKMYQAIRENDLRTISDLHASGDYPDLSLPDDVGNYPAHLAVLFDRREVLKLLHKKGVDLSKKCDSKGYGTPAFYAMHYGKTDMLSDLWAMGYDLSSPCDKYNLPPLYYATKKGDEFTARHLEDVMSRGTLQDVMALVIQRCCRGHFGRNVGRERKKERERYAFAQTLISGPWRGGVVRMRFNRDLLQRERLEAEGKDKEMTKTQQEGGGEHNENNEGEVKEGERKEGEGKDEEVSQKQPTNPPEATA